MKHTDYLIKKYLTPAQQAAAQAEREAVQKELSQRAWIDPVIDLMLQTWGNACRASQSTGGGAMSAIARLGVVRGKEITSTNRMAQDIYDEVQKVIRSNRLSIEARKALSFRYVRNQVKNGANGWNEHMAARVIGIPPKEVPSFTARAAAQVLLNLENLVLREKVSQVINSSTN